MAGKLRDRRLGFTIGWGLVGLVLIAVLLNGSQDSVEARRYRKYKYPGYKSAIARCKKACATQAGAIRACAKRAKGGGIKNCRKAFETSLAECTGSSQCRHQAKQALKQCKRGAGQTSGIGNIAKYTAGQSRQCGQCCRRTKGQENCGYSFRGNPFYGAHKYTGRTYRGRKYGGRKYKARLVCPSRDTSTTTATSSTTTSTNPPGSASAAFVDVSGRIRRQLARLVPWAIDGWTTD